MLNGIRTVTAKWPAYAALMLLLVSAVVVMSVCAEESDGDTSASLSYTQSSGGLNVITYGPLDTTYSSAYVTIEDETGPVVDSIMGTFGNGYLAFVIPSGLDENGIYNVSIGTSRTVDNNILDSALFVNGDISIDTVVVDTPLDVGDTAQLSVTTTPAALADVAEVTYSSSNPDVASIADGVLTAKSDGTATITASTVINGTTYSQTVQVAVGGGSVTPDVPVKSIGITGEASTIEVDSSIELTVTVNPSNATGYTLEVECTGGVTATISGNIVTVTGVSAGPATVTVYAVQDGGRVPSEPYSVTVTGGSEPVPVLTGITVAGPTVRAYEVGQTLNLDGLEVTAHYDIGPSETVETGYTVTPDENAPVLGSPYTESGRYTYTVTYQGLTATFTVDVADRTWGITYADAEHGTVSGDTRVVEGGNADYTVRADYGYVIESVTVGGQPVDIEQGLTSYSGKIEDVRADKTVTVTFVEDSSRIVTVTAGDHGSIGAGGATSISVTVYAHWPTTVTIDPDYGYRVSGFTVNGDGDYVSYADGVLTIAAGSNVTAISVSFEQIPVIDDDDEYVPPVITVIPDDGDDSTTYIVAIAAGVVVAILAALILMQTRKS